MAQQITTAGVGFGDSSHDPPCDGAYLTSNPTMRPATFIRTSHDQNVAFSNGRTLSYHTPLPRVDNAMVHNQRSVRSEERRVGKECRSRWSPQNEKKKGRKL